MPDDNYPRVSVASFFGVSDHPVGKVVPLDALVIERDERLSTEPGRVEIRSLIGDIAATGRATPGQIKILLAIAATVIPADGKKRVIIVADDEGKWPAPSVKAAGDRIRGALSGLHPVANSDAQRIGLWVLDALSEGEKP